MNNPNEAILLTDQGHPIGEVVVADNSYEPPVPTEQSVAENREAVLKSVAADMTGDPANADKVVAEWYPGYADAEKRAMARDLFVAGSRSPRSPRRSAFPTARSPVDVRERMGPHR